MRIYALSDIHACLEELDTALALVLRHMEEPDTQLIFLGDYVHGGNDGYRVLDRIMDLQKSYGADRVIALLGNHEERILQGYDGICDRLAPLNEDVSEDTDKYLRWFETMPRYYVEGNTIFCHAGINEESGYMWEWETSEDMYTQKYPAEVGKILDFDMKVVAGHVGTAVISGDPTWHDIYYDGESHYYIDGSVLDSGIIPVLMVDTETDEYYQITETGANQIIPYSEQ